MATSNITSNITSQFDPEKLQRVQELLDNMKEDARQAEGNGDTFMLGVYQQILKVTSPIVVKAHARVEREENARINRARKALMQRDRAARNSNQNPSEESNEPSEA